MVMSRFRVDWTGFPGGPGISTFYNAGGLSDNAFVTSLHDLFDQVKSHIPNTVTWTFPSSSDQIDEATGDLLGSSPLTQPANVVGGDLNVYAAPVGIEMRWNTGSVVASHRVVGRTFFVPAGNDADGSGGAPSSGYLATFQTAASAFVALAGTGFVIWARPFPGRPAAGTKPAVPARPGSFHRVTSAQVPDKFVVLRGRRD